MTVMPMALALGALVIGLFGVALGWVMRGMVERDRHR